MRCLKAASILAALFLGFLFSRDVTYSNSKVEFPESITGESLWIGAKKKIINVSASNGSRLLEVPVKHIKDIAADNYRGIVWAGTRKNVMQYTLKGREILRYPLKIKHEKNEEGSDDEDNAERLVHISLDPSDGSLWIGAKDEVIKLSHDGRELFKISTDHIVDVSVDISDGSCWVGLKDKAVKYTSDGEPVLVFNLEKWNRIHALATDPYSHSLWIGAKKGLIRIDKNGLEEFRSAEPHYIQDLKIDLTDGSLWLVTKKEVFKYSSYGYRLFSLRPCPENDKGDEEDDDKHKKRKDDNNGAKSHEDDYDDDCDNHEDDDHCEGNLITLAVDPSDSTCWIAWRKTVLKLSAAGEALLRLNGFKQIEALDIGLPELLIDIIEPLDGAIVNTPSITVKGTVTDSTARVTVNGITAPVTGNVFEAHDLPLTPGVNTITATAVNIYGSSVSDSITVTYEPALAIQIRSPSDGSVLPAPYTDVFGTVSDPSAYVEVNGLVASVVGNSFEVRKVPLNIGVNTITATAADIYGNSVSDSIIVTYEPPPLTIKILSPSDSSAFSSSRIDVTGTISDPEAKVSVNGIEAIVSEDTFTAKDIPLTLGENIVTAIAIDEYGRTASDTIRVNYTWLNISITYPGNGETFSDTPIDVFGTVSDPGAYVDINGKEAVVSADGSFIAHGVKLSPGENQITAQATNAAGQTDEDTVEVVYDPPLAPLSLNLLSPENGSIMEIPYFKVTGIVTDPNATVLVNDAIAQVDEDGFYTASIYACEPPETPEAGPPQSWVCTVTVSAYSKDGQTKARESLTYTYFPSDNPLTVRITEPSSNQIVTYSPYEIQGELNDVLSAVATARITVNGITPAAYGVGENSFSVSIALNDGLNYITVRATNAVGHDAFDTIKIIYDPPDRPLGISIYSPLDQAIVNYSPITVFGGATHSAAEVDVNGIYADFNKDFRSFKSVSVPLSPGENLITATVWIPSEETATDSRIVIYDPDYPSPPAPVLSELPAYSSGSTEISGLTITSYKVEIFANGTSRATVWADSNGLFKTTLYLPDEGPNHISAMAIDIYGNKSNLSNEQVVIRDTILPYPVISYDTLWSNLTNSLVEIACETEPFARVEIGIDNDPDYKYGGTANERGVFVIHIHLSAGGHSMIVKTTDKAGNTEKAGEDMLIPHGSGYISLSPIPPMIDPVSNPVNDNSITVEGNAYAGFYVEIYRNNELLGGMMTDNRGRFKFEGVSLVPGRNILKVRQTGRSFCIFLWCTDLLDAWSPEAEVDVISGIPARPNVKIDFPVNGSSTDAEFLPLRGTIDTPGATLRVNGYYNYTGYATAANGRFASSQKIPLLPGENTLWVEATSPDGSRGVDKITVYSKKDAQAPSVNITNPAEGEEVYDQFITTSGSAGDAVQKVIVNESEATTGDGTFEAVIDILSNYVYNPEGYERMITAWAMDANGNIGHHDIPFRYKYIPVPTLSITSPLNGEISGSSPITVTGSVQNASEVTVNGVPALIDKYEFTANIDLKEGQNAITAIAKNTVKASVKTIYVTYTPGSIITLQSVTIEPSPIGVPLGDTRRLRAIGTYSNGDRVDLTNVSVWTSADPLIATVNNGIVKGLHMYEYKNNTRVTASYGGLTGAVTVYVILPVVKSIIIAYESSGWYLTDNPVIISGEPFQFKAFGSYTDGSLADISTWGISWASSNTAIAAIDGGGVITAISKGTTEITATFGSLSATRTLTVFPPVYVFITSPVEGSAINSSEAMVKGIVINTSDKGNIDTGVVINGVAANVFGYGFIANHVPLTEGSNTITATAADGDGNTDRHSITVNAVTTGNYIRLTSNIESGIAPLEVILKIDGSFSITESSIGVAGPAQPEFLSSGADEYRLKFITEGIYYITVSSTDPDNITYQDKVAITVMNKTELDALLKGKWEGMKEALMRGDIETALNDFVEGKTDVYRETFNQLGQDNINSIFTSISDFGLSVIYDRAAECGAVRVDDDGTPYSYPVTFVKDENGIWKIFGF